MALNKKIELDNGIVLNYHRIVSINKIINHSTVIEIASYTNEEKREIEKEALEKGEPFDVFIHASVIEKLYVENETIEELYDYLKSLDNFKGSKNV